MMKTKSFTLLEVMFTLLLVMILLVSAGWYQQYQESKHKSQIAIAQVQQLITYAQIKSLQTNTAVTICPLSLAGCCSNDWSKSITAFIDVDKKHCLTSETQILKVTLGTLPQGKLSFHGFHSSQFLTIMPLILTEQQNGTFIYCAYNRDPMANRGLVVSKSGRSRLLLPQDVYFKQNKAC